MAARIPTTVGPAAVAATTMTTIYTSPNPSSLPTGMTCKAIVKHIHLQNPDTSSHTITISIGTDAAGKRIYDGYTLAAGTTKDDFPMYVLPANTVIQAAGVDGSTKIVYTIEIDEIILGG